MFVKFLGHTPSIFVEYNGIRYMFNNDGKPVDIPPEALRQAYVSGHIHAQDLLPMDSADVAKLTEEIKQLKEKIKELEAQPKIKPKKR